MYRTCNRGLAIGEESDGQCGKNRAMNVIVPDEARVAW